MDQASIAESEFVKEEELGRGHAMNTSDRNAMIYPKVCFIFPLCPSSIWYLSRLLSPVCHSAHAYPVPRVHGVNSARRTPICAQSNLCSSPVSLNARL